MNIVLVGLRGSGKTSIAKILSKKTGRDFVDIDQEVEKIENRKIAEIVEEHGWDYFREKEKQVAKEISDQEDKIIAAGGGTIVDPENAKSLKKSGKIIYLYRKPEDCIKYIMDDPNRPALTNLETLNEEMEDLYKQRNGIFCQNSFKIYHRTEDLNKDAEEIYKDLLSK